MINWLKQVVFWLEAHFPAKVVVKAEDYFHLNVRLDTVERQYTNAEALCQRISTLEDSAVHKEAVQTLIKEVIQLKEDVTAIKVNLGWGKPDAKSAEIQALLNGEVI